MEISENLDKSSNSEINKLIFANNQMKIDNVNYSNMIKSNNELIKQNEKQIWGKCKHIWKRDYNVAFDDRIKYYCSICKLWNNEYINSINLVEA